MKTNLDVLLSISVFMFLQSYVCLSCLQWTVQVTSVSLHTPVSSPTVVYFPIQLLLCPGHASCFSVSFSLLLAWRGRFSITAHSSSPPGPAVSTAWSFLIRSWTCLPPNRPSFVVRRWASFQGSWIISPFSWALKHIGKCISINIAKFWLPSGVGQAHMYSHTHTAERETDEISNTVCAVFVEDHLFLPVLLLAFSLYSSSADHSRSKHADHSQPNFL